MDEGYVSSSSRRSHPPSSPSSSSSSATPGSSPIQAASLPLGLHHYQQPSLSELQQQQQNHFIMQQQMMQHFYPTSPSSSSTVAGLATLLPRGPAAPWGLALPPAIGIRPLPPAPPPSSFRSSSPSTSSSVPPPSPSSTSLSPSSSSGSSLMMALDVDLETATTPPPPSHSPRANGSTSKRQALSASRPGGGASRRERCGLCDEWWMREARHGYPDHEGALLPKCPKCNKVPTHTFLRALATHTHTHPTHLHAHRQRHGNTSSHPRTIFVQRLVALCRSLSPTTTEMEWNAKYGGLARGKNVPAIPQEIPNI